jgi:hypothetical protein
VKRIIKVQVPKKGGGDQFLSSSVTISFSRNAVLYGTKNKAFILLNNVFLLRKIKC